MGKSAPKRRRRRWILLAASLSLLLAGLDQRLTTTTYRLACPKLRQPVCMLLLTDLHSSNFGEGQRRLVERIDRERPDVILLAGDIYEVKRPEGPVVDLLEAISPRYPCYFVTGNHEACSARLAEILALFDQYGVRTLAGEGLAVEVGEQQFYLCGIDDPAIPGGNRHQLEAALAAREEDLCTILLAHRPECFADYAAHPIDLVVSGHAHGGQWRIPLLLDGLYAPNQGFFPAYTGGVYVLEGTSMVVGRGVYLEERIVPRIFNRPEVVAIRLEPEA